MTYIQVVWISISRNSTRVLGDLIDAFMDVVVVKTWSLESKFAFLPRFVVVVVFVINKVLP